MKIRTLKEHVTEKQFASEKKVFFFLFFLTNHDIFSFLSWIKNVQSRENICPDGEEGEKTICMPERTAA